MAYRGYLTLDGVEIANSSRAVSHLGGEVPTMDSGMWSTIDDGSYVVDPDDPNITVDPTFPWIFTPGVGFDTTGMVEHPESPGQFLLEWHPWTIIESTEHPGLGLPHETQAEVSEGLWTPPFGARIFGPGLFVHDQPWGSPTICAGCRTAVIYDDTWTGLREWLGDADYRPELAPWYSAEIPESHEFGGVWIMSLEGLDSTPVERNITQAIGHGGVPGPSRDPSRTLVFEALLFGCTNAGVEYGLKWLANRLRSSTFATELKLRYLTASPQGSAADPTSLLREVYGAVLTSAPKVLDRLDMGARGQHQHGTVYRIQWEISLLSPYAYMPEVPVLVDWDQITRQPINWIHAADCAKPETCVDMPIMFSAECTPEEIERIETPPPVCGGCLPVSAIDKYSFRMPTMEFAFRGRETAVSLVITNHALAPLTLQAFFRQCGTDIRCEDNLWPLQVSGLPAGAELHLSGITGRAKIFYDTRWRRPVGIVGTPNGAPWRPPLIDRQTCLDFIVQAASTASFTVKMVLADREA